MSAHPEMTWSSLARRAPGVARRETVTKILLAMAVFPGAWLIYGLIRYGAVFHRPDVLLPVLAHLIALGACFLPAHRAVTGTVLARLSALSAGSSVRGTRLALLGRVALLEGVITFGWAPIASLAFGEPLRWGPWFTLSTAMVLLIWPLERLVRAEATEGRRLLRRTLSPAPATSAGSASSVG